MIRNITLTKKIHTIIKSILIRKPVATRVAIGEKIGMSAQGVERYIKELKKTKSIKIDSHGRIIGAK